MTLIGFATYGDHAELITDTASYTRHVEELSVTTKHMTLNHIDAAVLTQGDGRFGDYAMIAALQVAGQVPGFDQLVDQATNWLTQMHEDADRPEDCVVFLVGWSSAAEAFVAYACASEQDFRPLKVSRWIMPTPWSMRPTGLELRRVVREMPDRDLAASVRDLWPLKPAMKSPRSIEEWVQLAQDCREQRCLEHMHHVIVAGSLIHTCLSRGEVVTRKVHDFPDDQELLAVVQPTRHPLAQMQACWCGSGEVYRDCHLRGHWAEPCGCRSGRTFYECHMVPEFATDSLTTN